MDDDVELRRLREQVYSVDGAEATPAMIARLAELKEGVRPATAEADPPPKTPDADPPAPVADVAEPIARRPALRATLIGLGAVALVGLGVAFGSTLSAPPSTSAARRPLTPPRRASPSSPSPRRSRTSSRRRSCATAASTPPARATSRP